MFRTLGLTILLFTALAVRADVVPNVPGPGVVYKTGGVCHIGWDGDKSSNTIWKGMSIELMTGSNFNMVHLTTVATGQDGTVSGTFDHPCPSVTPNSAIYFYQFTGPTAANRTWTTRFTIAGLDGSSVPPANPIQPTTGDKIPWGTGALTDPSKAVPPPAYLSTATATAGNTIASTSSPTTSDPTSNSTSTTSTPTISPLTTDTPKPTTSATTTAVNGTTTSSQNSAAMGLIIVDNTLWGAAFTLALSAMGFAVLL